MEQLLTELKEYLGFTWGNHDERLTSIIGRGKVYLQSIADINDNEFLTESNAKALLFDYCRYVIHYSLEHFENNFNSALVRLKFEHLKNDIIENEVNENEEDN